MKKYVIVAFGIALAISGIASTQYCPQYMTLATGAGAVLQGVPNGFTTTTKPDVPGSYTLNFPHGMDAASAPMIIGGVVSCYYLGPIVSNPGLTNVAVIKSQDNNYTPFNVNDWNTLQGSKGGHYSCKATQYSPTSCGFVKNS
jgi:hypothetical protein